MKIKSLCVVLALLPFLARASSVQPPRFDSLPSDPGHNKIEGVWIHRSHLEGSNYGVAFKITSTHILDCAVNFDDLSKIFNDGPRNYFYQEPVITISVSYSPNVELVYSRADDTLTGSDSITKYYRISNEDLNIFNQAGCGF